MKKVKLGNSIAYLVGNGVIAIIPLISLSILSHLIPPKEHGSYAVFLSYMLVIVPFVGLSASGLIVSRLSGEEEKGKAAVLFSTSILISVLNCCVFGAILWFLLYFGPKDLMGLRGFGPANILIFVFCYSFVQSVTAYFNAQKRVFSYLIVRFAMTFFTAFVPMVLIYFDIVQTRVLIIGAVIAALITAFGAMVYLVKDGILGMKVSRYAQTSLFRFGVPLLPHAIATIFLSMGDRWMISSVVGEEEGGVYAVGAQFASVVLLFTASLNQAYVPEIGRVIRAGTEQSRVWISKVSLLMILGIFFVSVFVSVSICFLLPFLLGEGYETSIYYASWLAMAYFFHGMYQVVSIPLFLKEKTATLSSITAFCSVLHFFLIGLSVYYLGAKYVPFACLVSFLVFSIVTFYYANLVFALPWKRGLDQTLVDFSLLLNVRS